MVAGPLTTLIKPNIAGGIFHIQKTGVDSALVLKAGCHAFSNIRGLVGRMVEEGAGGQTKGCGFLGTDTARFFGA